MHLQTDASLLPVEIAQGFDPVITDVYWQTVPESWTGSSSKGTITKT